MTERTKTASGALAGCWLCGFEKVSYLDNPCNKCYNFSECIKKEEMLNEIRKRSIIEFSLLKEGWNGYSSLPIPIAVINYCLKIADLLPEDMRVCPTGRESIQFELEKNGYYIEIEIYKDKYGFLLMKKNDIIIEFETTIDLLPDMLGFIRNICYHYLIK